MSNLCDCGRADKMPFSKTCFNCVMPNNGYGNLDTFCGEPDLPTVTADGQILTRDPFPYRRFKSGGFITKIKLNHEQLSKAPPLTRTHIEGPINNDFLADPE